MSLINISNLTFAYDGSYNTIFKNVSFQIDTDWRLGFIGRNGRGKTTFMKLLMGELEYNGTISSSVDFEYFPYPVSDTSAFVIDVIRGISQEAQDWEIYRETSLLGLSDEVMYLPFNIISGGEQTKAMLAAMFLRENAFLLIDEPTNHLDSEGRKLLAEYLARKKGFILISHDRAFLDICTDHTLSINRCGIDIQKGSFSSWQRNKDMQDNFETAQNEKLKKDIKRLEVSAKRSAEWSDKAERSKIGFDPHKVEKSISRRAYEGAKAKKLMSRAAAIAERRSSAIQEKSNLMKNVEHTAVLKLSPLQFHSHQLLQLDKAKISYNGKIICSNVSFTVNRGDRIALCGKNGCGKSSILKLICGENIEYSGNFYKGSQLKISYVSQTSSHLCGLPEQYALQIGADPGIFMAILRKLDFERSQFEKRIEDFSAGQKKKVLIAGSLCQQAHLYIWDEPLNFIDIISRMQLEELILKYLPTMIFVEHDDVFRRNIATKTIEIK